MDAPYVTLNPTESFVVLNQGRYFVEGYLAKKPKNKYEMLESDLRRVVSELKQPKAIVKNLLVVFPWDRALTRGIVLSLTGSFVDVFLLDYGIRECCSARDLYILPENFRKAPAYGIRVELEASPSSNLRDDTVILTSLHRLSAISAKGSVTGDKLCANETCTENIEPVLNGHIHIREKFIKTNALTVNGETEIDVKVGAYPDHVHVPRDGVQVKQRRPREEFLLNEIRKTNHQPHLTKTGAKQRTIIGKPPNDSLLEMIGTRCFLCEILVMEVQSSTELVCAHYPSLQHVRRSLDEMNVLPSPISRENVKLDMLVLVLCKAALHRAIVTAAPVGESEPYCVEFIDLPGHTQARILYYAPTTVAHSAPRALMKVRLWEPVKKSVPGDLVTLLCDRVSENTAYGYLVVKKSDEALLQGITKSKL